MNGGRGAADLGELVQWDTSDHDWLEGRGEEMLLINMIDDATSRWFARFVRSDSTVENMNLLERYLKKHGRPLALLHRQSVDLSNRGEDQTRREPSGEKTGRSCRRRRSAGRCRNWESSG